MNLSVAICSHNPRPRYLTRVLEALKAQTLARGSWELLLIDNVSQRILANDWDLTWHPEGRHVREDSLGLTNARLRAIREAAGELIVFVDDDNVLEENYLAECMRIANEMPFLGVWGGQQIGEFEISPPDWMKPYLTALAVREFSFTRWCNLPHGFDTLPSGAGMCVRMRIARAWSEKTREDQNRRLLGRIGDTLNSCEDTDLALAACDLGFGTGLFASLRLSHLIPKERLELRYLSSLMEGMARSNTILVGLRSEGDSGPPKDFFHRGIGLLRAGVRECRLWRMPAAARALERAKDRGRRSALKLQKERRAHELGKA